MIAEGVRAISKEERGDRDKGLRERLGKGGEDGKERDEL